MNTLDKKYGYIFRLQTPFLSVFWSKTDTMNTKKQRLHCYVITVSL